MALIGNLIKLQNHLAMPELDPVFDYLKSSMESNSAIYKRIVSYDVGAFERVQINEELFALEQVFMTKDRTDCFIESHKKYVDFQLIISGVEQMEYVDIDKLIVKKPYDVANDLIVYKSFEKTSKIVMEGGDLAVYFPDDAHIGMPKYKSSSLVYKTVVKVPLNYF